MADVFISYARSTEPRARRVEAELRTLGYSVWRDDELPTHRLYAEVIEERLRSAKAVIVLWSLDAVKSEWVRAEADVARKLRTLTQATLDGSSPPLPFNQIQCADLRGWPALGHPGWGKITASVAELLGRADVPEVAQPSERLAPERIRISVGLRPIIMASGRDAQGLATGLNGELSKAMACLPGLRVQSAQAGNAEQNSPYLVDGALQRSGDQLRLAVRLFSSADGSILWSEKYDGTRRELFDFQERAAMQIASNVDTLVRMREIEKTAGVPEQDLDIRQLYYRAIGGLRRLERNSLSDGARYAESLIELAPDHAHALAVAACIDLNIWMLGFGGRDGDMFRQKAAERASRALSVSSDDHWVEALSAMVLAWIGQPIDVSIAQLDRIRAAAPSFAAVWFWSGLIQIRAGALETAVSHLNRAIELEPLTPQRSTMASYGATARVIAGDFSTALPLLVEGLRARPQWTSLYVFSAIALANLGRIDEARSQLETSESIAPLMNSRWPTRDGDQRDLLCKGLAKAGIADPAPIFSDV